MIYVDDVVSGFFRACERDGRARGRVHPGGAEVMYPSGAGRRSAEGYRQPAVRLPAAAQADADGRRGGGGRLPEAGSGAADLSPSDGFLLERLGVRYGPRPPGAGLGAAGGPAGGHPAHAGRLPQHGALSPHDRRTNVRRRALADQPVPALAQEAGDHEGAAGPSAPRGRPHAASSSAAGPGSPPTSSGSAAAPGPAATSSAITSVRRDGLVGERVVQIDENSLPFPTGDVRRRGGDQLPRAHRGRRPLLRRDGARAEAGRRVPLHGAQGRARARRASRSSGCWASRRTRRASATRATAILPRPRASSWSGMASPCGAWTDYCRVFTESLEDLLNFAYHRKATKDKTALGAGLPRRHRADVARRR